MCQIVRQSVRLNRIKCTPWTGTLGCQPAVCVTQTDQSKLPYCLHITPSPTGQERMCAVPKKLPNAINVTSKVSPSPRPLFEFYSYRVLSKLIHGFLYVDRGNGGDGGNGDEGVTG